MGELELVPKLRFPEFLEAGEWVEKTLGEVTYKVSHKNKDGKVYPVYSINNKTGFIPQYEQFDGVDSNKRGYDITLYNIVHKNTFVYNPARINVGSLGYSGELENIIISSLYVCFKTINIVDDKFLLCFFDTTDFIKSVKKNTEGGIRSYLFYENFSIIRALFPPLSEQQKIADCLSSLDDLITAENQKLDALKRHKKGLMQQLFPAEGETVPKLRFPEFLEAGEWIFEEFSKYIVLYRGSSPRPIQDYLTNDSNGVNWIKIGDTKYAKNFVISHVDEKITPKGTMKSRKVNIGDLILANSMSYGKTYQVAIDGYIYDGWFVLHNYEEYFDKQFLLQLLNSEYMQNQYKKLSAGGIVQNISSEIVYSTILPNTSLPEQQKIAACLSSLDDLITAQSKKIDTLKKHKQGLMQQLFPQTEA